MTVMKTSLASARCRSIPAAQHRHAAAQMLQPPVSRCCDACKHSPTCLRDFPTETGYNLLSLAVSPVHRYLFQGAEPGPPFTTDEHLVENSGAHACGRQLFAACSCP